MENTATEIICILDKSGSMAHLRGETISGLNQFIQKQLTDHSDCKLSLVQFNQEVTFSKLRVPIKQFTGLSKDFYHPDGYTALNDAIGLTINKFTNIFYRLPDTEKPNQVLVFIITDGQENASRTYDKQMIKQLIAELTLTNGWEFEFFGANIDSFHEAENLGIDVDKTMNWSADKAGMSTMFEAVSAKAMAFRKKRFL